jgi:fimbrial chaperone protein
LNRLLVVAAFLSAVLIPASAWPGDWRVTPIRLDLGRQARSGVITVISQSKERLQLQIKAYEWTQDSEGKDRYEETGDLIFFPKMMMFEMPEERILRAGIKVPATKREKTYRLFLEEIPGPRKAEGVSVAIAIRFGVPIFVAPLTEEPQGKVSQVAMKKGTVEVDVRNPGNVHFVIQSVTVKGKNAKGEEIFSREISGWYLLAGASRRYKTEVPADLCKELSAVDVTVSTDKFPLTGHLDVDTAMCSKE